jgi:hypothetical protein
MEIITKNEVKEMAKQAIHRGRKASETTKAFTKLKVGEGFKTNKMKCAQIRGAAWKQGKRVSIKNLGNNSYLVIRTA